MGVTDRVYFKDAAKVSSLVGVDVPRNAFHPAALDMIYSSDEIGDGSSIMDEQLLEFISDFLSCGCEDAPFCSHPEVKFIHHLIELRRNGLEAHEIVDELEADYGLYIYPGDVLDFLDSSVRNFEAIEEVAETLGETDISEEARSLQSELIGAKRVD